MGQLAAQAYMQGGGSLGGLETILSSKGPQEVIDRASGMAVVSDLRTQVLQEASATSVVAGVLQRQAARAQAQQLAAAQAAESARAQAQAMADAAQAQTAAIQRQQAQLVAQLAALRHTSVALEGRRQAGLKAEAEARAAAAAKAEAERRAREAARREAARREAARQEAARQEAARQEADRAGRQRRREAAPSQAAGPGPGPPAPVVVAPPAPAPVDPPARRSGGVGAVLGFAQAQMGEPYVWGAEGPGSWDCSGLTMKAWQQAGVYLSHYTGFQWAETRHLPISARQPGDLIFYGVSGAASHHVGLYIGGDQMIEAPHTGRQRPRLQHLAAGHHHGGRPALSRRPPRHAERGATATLRWRPSRIVPADGGSVPGARRVSGWRSARASGPSSSRRPWPAGGSSGSPPRPRRDRPSGRPRPTCRARGPCRSRRSAGSPGGRTR